MSTSLPNEFIQNIQSVYPTEANALLECISEHKAPTSIRLNPHKIPNSVKSSFASFEPIPWAENAYYLDRRINFTTDPVFQAGAYYVQEASSMAVQKAYQKTELSQLPFRARCLDLCAAPGGKSSLLNSLLRIDDLLIANEIIPKRAQILKDNLLKWGNPNTIISNNDSKAFAQLGPQFDFILADVPCSGEGMFRRDEKAIEEWSLANVDICATRQQNIINDIDLCLKDGGYVVYSTCTFNRKENEERVEQFIKMGYETIPLNLESFGFISIESNKGYHALPNKVKGEGFFICLLKKAGNLSPLNDSHIKKNSKLKLDQSLKKSFDIIHSIKEDYLESYTIENEKDYIVLANQAHHSFIKKVSSRLKFICTNTRIAEKGIRQYEPSHELANSITFNSDVFPITNLDIQEAYQFLKGNAIVNTLQQNNYTLLKFAGQFNLGFGKAASNRINNKLPKALRIRRNYSLSDVESILSIK